MDIQMYLREHIAKCAKRSGEIDNELNNLTYGSEQWHSCYRTLTREYGRLSAFQETLRFIEGK